MKSVLVALHLMLAMMIAQPSFAKKIKVDQSKFTCQQLKDVLNEYGSIWVKSKIFPWVYQNIALYNPVCNGSDRSRRDRICRYYKGYATTKDGGCQLGTECSCSAPEKDDD